MRLFSSPPIDTAKNVAEYVNPTWPAENSPLVGQQQEGGYEGGGVTRSGKDVEVETEEPAGQLEVPWALCHDHGPTCLAHNAISRSFQRVGILDRR